MKNKELQQNSLLIQYLQMSFVFEVRSDSLAFLLIIVFESIMSTRQFRMSGVPLTLFMSISHVSHMTLQTISPNIIYVRGL